MTPEILSAISAAVAVDASPVVLRDQFPGVHFTFCSEDDITSRCPAVGEAGDYMLYLVTGASGHCLALTNDMDAATGLVVASKSLDD
jgi:hypothetical protein